MEKGFTITVLAGAAAGECGGYAADATGRVWGSSSYDVVLHLTAGAAALDLASIDGDELVVTGPGGAVAVTLVACTALRQMG